MQTAERSWSIKHSSPIDVIVEGVRADIPQIVSDILDPKSKLGIIARSKVFILNTRGFSILLFEEEFSRREAGSLYEFFPVRASYNIAKDHYVVEFSDREAFKKGQILA